MLSDEAKANARESRRRYDREHMATLAVKLPIELAEEFRAYANAHNTTVSRLLADCVYHILRGGESVDEGKRMMRVTYRLWASTIERMKQIAEQSNVPVDDLVNGVLCEFIANWSRRS